MQLASPYYEQVRDGMKCIEGRLNTGKWSNAKVGSIFAVFPATKDEAAEAKDTAKTEYMLVFIENVQHVKNFQKLYEKYGNELLPGTKHEDRPWTIYNEWYKSELVNAHGVVGLTMRVICITK